MNEDKSGNKKTYFPDKSQFALVRIDVKAESWEEVRAKTVTVLSVLDDS